MINILVVEDDKDLSELFCSAILEANYNPIAVYDGMQAFDFLEEHHIDLVISDIMMPNMDGLEMSQHLRKFDHHIPILIISARSNLDSRRIAFEAGVDDYMIKPINLDEMIWRIEALLRRSQINTKTKIKFGNTSFDKENLTVHDGIKEILLVQKEFLLLYKLVSSPDKIFTRRQIMDEIWGLDNESDTHTLDVHISRLRDKFKNNDDFKIVTIRGLGYKLIKKES